MGRLIDADAITESKELAKKIRLFDFEPYIKTADLIEFIDNLPTAYDVEKVVAELEKESKPLGFGLIPDAKYISESKAIDIVRKGGVDG